MKFKKGPTFFLIFFNMCCLALVVIFCGFMGKMSTYLYAFKKNIFLFFLAGYSVLATLLLMSRILYF
jgi:hypothetical protein